MYVEVNKSGVYMRKGEYFDLLLLITDASFPGRHNYIREEFYDDGLKKIEHIFIKILNTFIVLIVTVEIEVIFHFPI